RLRRGSRGAAIGDAGAHALRGAAGARHRMTTMLSPFLLRHRDAAAVVVHAAIVTLAYTLAFALRFDFAIPADMAMALVLTLPLVLACRLGAFWACGVFRGSWRYLNMHDVEDVVRASVLGSALFLS